MRVLIAGSFRPASEPGQTDLARALALATRDHGHDVDTISIPFDPEPDALWAQLLAFRLTDVSDVGDVLIATAAPCHLLRHPRKVLWLTEHYPWFESGSAPLHSLQMADRRACAEATGAFAISPALCDRVAGLTSTPVEVLPPPPEGSWGAVVAALTADDYPTTTK
jgi:hypothetical protein